MGCVRLSARSDVSDVGLSDADAAESCSCDRGRPPLTFVLMHVFFFFFGGGRQSHDAGRTALVVWRDGREIIIRGSVILFHRHRGTFFFL